MDVSVFRFQWLTHAGPEVQRTEQEYVSQREACASNERLTGNQAVEPGDALLRERLEVVGRLRKQPQTVLEDFKAFRRPKAVEHRLHHVEVDASRPHPRYGALFRR